MREGGVQREQGVVTRVTFFIEVIVVEVFFELIRVVVGVLELADEVLEKVGSGMGGE